MSHLDGRSAFAAAAQAFGQATTGLRDGDLLAATRCRGWTVVDVLVHVHLGLQEMLLGLAVPTEADPDTDAASYWRSAPPSNDGDADAVDQIRFVRAVAAAYRRPRGAAAHLLRTLDALDRVVHGLPAGHLSFQGHVLRTGDFLATWAVELAVHQLDIALELDLPPPPPTPLALARDTVEALAGALPASWDDTTVVLLGAGRTAPDDAQRLAAGAVVDRLPVLG